MTLHECLTEAARRYTRFHRGKLLTEALVGLGTASDYRTALRGGYMALVYGRTPYCIGWLRLTDKGAAIVQRWLDEGVTYQSIEAGRQPSPIRLGQ